MHLIARRVRIKKKGATRVAPNYLYIMLITLDICLESLSDAKIPKNIPQNLVGRNLSDDAAEVVDRFADVLGGEVGREAGGEAGADAEEGGAGVGEGLDVALVGDEGGVAVAEEITLGGGEMGTEIGDSGAGFCGDRNH